MPHLSESAKENQSSSVSVILRKQEILFVSAISFVIIFTHFFRAFVPTNHTYGGNYAEIYGKNHLAFHYGLNVLLPQVGMVLILYCWYLFINQTIAPFPNEGSMKKGAMEMLRKWAILLTKLLVASYLLALSGNILTYFAHPWLFNYGGFALLSLFGYNDSPLTNATAGWDHALLMTVVYATWVFTRELVVAFLQRLGSKSYFRVMVVIQITGFLFIYLFLLWIIQYFNLFDEPQFFARYFSIVTPILLVTLSNMYFLFPMTEEASLLSAGILSRLFLSTLMFSLPFFLFPAVEGHPFLFIGYWVAQLAIVTPLSWFVYRQRKDKILQLRNMEKALLRSTTDIRFLRSQINPHFLFNTLNTLYGTAIQEGSTRAAEGIQKLGDMMRFMLHENNQDFISLQSEVDYLLNYISLQKLRIQPSDQIRIETQIDSGGFDHDIAPMLLIPLIENAFKHGISLVEPSWINCSLTHNKEAIYFCVRNSMHPQRGTDTESHRSGIGINNVVKRLKLIYPNRHHLEFNGDGKEFFVRLSIQW
jgi:hypothetical protein